MPTRTVGPVNQDWDTVVLKKRAPKASDLRDSKAVAAALRSGATVQVVKKFDVAKNHTGAGPLKDPRKLDSETEPGSLDRVSSEVRQAIQKDRLAKGLTQIQLAKAISERPQVVQEYESGKAVPSQQILAKMEKLLDVKLRGKLR
ncbi:hypothetical protein KP509_21G003600 [Ceratopteris richardii]|uniref:HTH cro/C1-type domain-containing protein n=1 Tax=Ceratopteris richardii TaxID=49495 RepID=A0A8T2S728_CERRI|nr:hypothetical protein KP509_21G003600 [Ceratopteris richardii]